MRVTKNPDERRIEIIETANRLFEEKGFSHTTVTAITNELGVAKGTFYYYFNSKKDVIDAIVDHSLKDIVDKGEALVAKKELSVLKRLSMILSGVLNSKETVMIRENLHRPNNRELHEKMNIASIKALTPVISQLIEQGRAEGSLEVSEVEDTAGFLMTGIQFYLDEMLFCWPQEELQRKRICVVTIIEKCLGIKEKALHKEVWL